MYSTGAVSDGTPDRQGPLKRVTLCCSECIVVSSVQTAPRLRADAKGFKPATSCESFRYLSQSHSIRTWAKFLNCRRTDVLGRKFMDIAVLTK